MSCRKKFLFLWGSICSCVTGFTQIDSVNLYEVIIRSYPGDATYIRVPASVVYIDSAAIGLQHGQSLVPSMNTAAGVRMEERSPGSYRLSIRGSLLRSPFGIRNTKVYLDEFPLTNAGGETYLNLLDPGIIKNVEVLKGPDGSLFGANSGGVVRLGLFQKTADSANAFYSVSAGSYKFFKPHFGLQVKIFPRNLLSVDVAYQTSDGFREHSAFQRKQFIVRDESRYKSGNLKALFFISDLSYETPGGLTLDQFRVNARAARPNTQFTRGATEQKAGVFNRSFFGGISNRIDLFSKLKWMFAANASITAFLNPFITNYEKRNEKNAGVRTWLEFAPPERNRVKTFFCLGAEFQRMQAVIQNSDNFRGTPGPVLLQDDFSVSQGFLFCRISHDFFYRIRLDYSVSYNHNSLLVNRLIPVHEASNIKLSPQLMPRMALSFTIHKDLVARAIISKGYSVPTLQEFRASDTRLNTGLLPESGWNYELGLKFGSSQSRVSVDMSAFYYKLDNAIVRRINLLGEEYFENSGGTIQPGLEGQLAFTVIRKNDRKFCRAMELRCATHYYAFRFSNYESAAGNFTGNMLTGVPRHSVNGNVHVAFPGNLYFFLQNTHVSRLPLDDANSVYLAKCNVLLAKVGFNSRVADMQTTISLGIDNIFDKIYSLGPDLNAPGGRYYNQAPGRNYFAQLRLFL
jgi:iron complex outermembrane recepter protein